MRLALVFAGLCAAACGDGGKAQPRPADAAADAPVVPTDDGAAGAPVADAGPDGPRAPRLVTVTGPVTELAANRDLTLPDSTVQLDGDDTSKVTSDPTGTFALRVQVRSPFVLAGSHAGHVTTRLYELQLGLDELMFREMRLPTDATFDAWTAHLPGYDAQKGLVRVEIRAYGSGACGVAGGATVSLEPAAGTVVYAVGDDPMHLPDPSLTASAATDSLGFAFIHGVPAGTYTVHVEKAGCQAEAWPLAQLTRTYTGRTVVAAGRAVSLPFVVLK